MKHVQLWPLTFFIWIQKGVWVSVTGTKVPAGPQVFSDVTHFGFEMLGESALGNKLITRDSRSSFKLFFFLLSFPATASKTQTLNAQTLFLEIRIGLGVTWFTKKENTHYLQDHNYIWYHVAGGRLNYKAFLSCLQRKSDEACVTIRAWSFICTASVCWKV